VNEHSEALAQRPRCIVCGKPVDPKVDIMLTAGSVELVPVHQGACRQTIRRGVVVVRNLLETRYPALRFARTLFKEISKRG